MKHFEDPELKIQIYTIEDIITSSLDVDEDMGDWA